MLDVPVRQSVGARQPLLDRGPAAGLDVRVRELAQRADQGLAIAGSLGRGDRLVQEQRALLVAPAHRVHQRAAEGEERASVHDSVAARQRLGAGLAQEAHAVLDRAGADGGCAPLQMRTRRAAVAGHGLTLGRGPRGAAHGGRRLDAELAPKQARARLRLRERSGAIAARGEAADQQLVVGLVERVECDEAGGQLGGTIGIPGGELVQRSVVERRRGLSGVPTARDHEP